MSSFFSFVKLLVSKTPLLISATTKHYLNGPPKPSWDLNFHLVVIMIKSIFEDVSGRTIEHAQRASSVPIPVPDGVMINEFKINNQYRYEAQVYIEEILKPYEHVLDTDWKDLKDDGIISEWVKVPNDGWDKREIKKTILYLHGGAYYLCSKGSYRNITGSLAKKANARVLGMQNLKRMKSQSIFNIFT
jgi:hypothetical protein